MRVKLSFKKDITGVNMQQLKNLSVKFEHKLVQQMSTKMQQNQIIEWRRAKVIELLSKGQSNQSGIAKVLQIDKSIMCRDIAYLRQRARTNVKKYIDDR